MKRVRTEVLPVEESVSVDWSEMPEYQSDQMCRIVIAAVKRMFQDPRVQEDYQRWLAEEKKAEKEAGRME